MSRRKQATPQRRLTARPGEDGIIADETPTPRLIALARELAANPHVSPEAASKVLWSAVKADPPSMPPQQLARWHDDPGRRNAAMRGLITLATDPERRGQSPDEVLHLWANGMEGDPGAYERAHPAPPRRTLGQVIGYETDFHADQRHHPLMDGVRADWHNVSNTVGEKLAEAAHFIGATRAEQRLLDDAARDREAAAALQARYRYDPNAYIAFQAGRYGRGTVQKVNTARTIWGYLRK